MKNIGMISLGSEEKEANTPCKLVLGGAMDWLFTISSCTGKI